MIADELSRLKRNESVRYARKKYVDQFISPLKTKQLLFVVQHLLVVKMIEIY
jgi:hypothetical protein